MHQLEKGSKKIADRLEERINGNLGPRFKSEGERRIAYFLDTHDIQYIYEPPVLVTPSEKQPRIWYPDYYLPEFAVYIEYFGLAGRQDYDQGIRKKKDTYAKMGLPVISVYPWHFENDWQGYIKDKIYQITNIRQRKAERKLYRSFVPKSTYKKPTSHGNPRTRARYSP